MSLISEIWSILGPAQRRSVLVAQAISLAMALSTVTGIAAIAPFFAVLGNPELIDQRPWLHWLYEHGGFQGRHAFVATLGIAFIMVVVLANVVNATGSLAMNRLAQRIGYQMQTGLFREYLSRPYLFHTGTNSATLFNNVVYEVWRFSNGILRNMFMLVTSMAAGSLIVVSILLVNPVLSVVMLLGLAGGYGLIYLFMRERLLQVGQAHSQAWSERGRIVSEGFAGIRELLLLPDRRLICEDFDRTAGTVSEASAHLHAVGLLPKHIMECAAVSALVGVALISSAHERTGSWLGQLTFIAFASYRLLPMLQQIYSSAASIRADRSGFDVIAPDLQRMRESMSSANANAARLPDSWWHERPRGEIQLRELSFQYAAAGPRTLDGVNLRIAARAMVGVVGANGSGKTTLMDLIAGLILPTSGEVQIDGVALDVANCTAWHAQVAYVPQNVFLLDSSIAQNIALGVPKEAIDRRRLTHAARLAQLEDFVETLPQGYDHRVGERGIQLSGGQRQRIGIARALYKRASVLLLDEATGALDGLTEAELVTTLGNLRGRYTIVLISHQMSTVRSCDLIVQLQNGRIDAVGSYAELTRKSELFDRTVRA